MLYITEQEQLLKFCERAKQASYVTIDTEFMRENTFYAQLCLVQMAYPAGDEDDTSSAVIDVLAKGVDLAPVLEIFRDESIVKVFHAARQDLEIFHHDYGVLPKPFFDTQIAAMVAGYGDQVGYETLVRDVAKGKIDKSSRFTDWSKRPLSDAQLQYAAADVSFLRTIYEVLSAKLAANGRIEWVQEEFAALLEPELYDPPIDEVWKKVRARSNSPKFLAYLKALATFREQYARENNVPRSRVFKDDALLEAAAQKPMTPDALKKLRLWRGGVKSDIASGVIAAIQEASQMPAKDYPHMPSPTQNTGVQASVIDLLRVYLKAQSERNDVAQRLICTSGELEDFAADPEAPSPLNQGWRRKVFGADARKIIEGQAALKSDGRFVKLVDVNEL